MSEVEDIDNLKVEIQKLLGEINRDMNKLKNEVASLNHILEGDASLAMNAKMVNERLMIAAKEIGIDLDDLEVESSEEEEAAEGNVSSERNTTQNDSSNDDESERDNAHEESTRPSAATVEVAVKKLTKQVKRALR